MTHTAQHRGWTSEMGRRAAGGALALAIILVATAIASRPLQAQTFTVLYAFKGGVDGYEPLGNLARDAAGNLYGTTVYGGMSGYGVVFKLAATGKETTLHSFTGTDGALPQAGLVRDAAGNFYGTTMDGGALGWGTVFKLDKTGKETVLLDFDGEDGAGPTADLVRDAAGDLYGPTQYGGTGGCNSPGCGVVFKLAKTGEETLLHSFTGTGGDGNNPYAALVRDAAGNLYGTDAGGAYGYGTVFKLDKTGKETVLYSFTGYPDDGCGPVGGVIRDAAGNFYGTTLFGGTSDWGTVFELDKTGKEAVLYSFTGGSDGRNPWAGVVLDAKGNLYGTTEAGGDHNNGTVFMVDETGTETVLHAFIGGNDGAAPVAALIWDRAGNLYGTAMSGGTHGVGTVFKLTP